MTKVISVSIHKGGAGKSSISCNLGLALSQLNYKVLLIDTDSQMNLSHSYGFYKNERNFFKSFVEKQDIRNHIINTPYENLDIVIGDIGLIHIENILSTIICSEKRMREVLDPVIKSGYYDFILIDTSPSLAALNVSILFASDYILIPVEPSAFGIEGLDVFLDHFNEVKKYHQELEIMGVVLNRVDARTTISKVSVDVIKNVFGEHLLTKSFIRVDSDITKAQWEHVPVYSYNKNSRSIEDFNNLAKEIEMKIKEKEPF